MGLEPGVIRRLMGDAGRFGPSGQRTYLDVAIQHLRRHRSLAETLRLLERMWGGSYASSDGEKKALADVTSWLALRVLGDAAVTVDRILLELGFLRRCTVIRGEAHLEDRDFRRQTRTSSRGAPASFEPPFRSLVEKALQALENASAAAVVAQTRVSAPVVVRPKPTELPEVIEVEFVDLAAVRQARDNAIERKRKKKPPKPVVPQKLRPTDPDLVPLAVGLTCTIDTPGVDEVFEAFHANAGRPRPFYATAITRGEGKLEAGRVLLRASTSPAGT